MMNARRVLRKVERSRSGLVQDGLWKVRVADVGREEFQEAHVDLLAGRGDDRRRLKQSDRMDCRDWLKASEFMALQTS